VLARTPAGALSAILRPEGRFRHLSPAISLKNAPDDSGAAAWLCTEVNGGRFRADAGTKAAFSQETVISDNGERARSLPRWTNHPAQQIVY